MEDDLRILSGNSFILTKMTCHCTGNGEKKELISQQQLNKISEIQAQGLKPQILYHGELNFKHYHYSEIGLKV